MHNNSEPATQAKERRMPWLAVGALLLAWAGMFVYRPATMPALWFDEGWSLSVARNWVELGRYARLLDGQPISAVGMAQPFAATAPIALGFQLLGVGAWQGRLPGAFFTLVTLALLYALARRFYGSPVATATLFVAILLPMNAELNPLLIGRQALAEMPMLFYLLLGYWFFWLAFRRKRWLLPALIFWGIALTTKGHAIPFWLSAMLVPLVLALHRRSWQTLRMLLLVSLGAPAMALAFNGIQRVLETDLPLYGAPMIGLLNVTVLVPQPEVRLAAWRIVVLYGIPTILGLAWALWDLKRRRWTIDTGSDLSRLSFVVLVGGWFLWYLLLSVNWARYFFPATFLGSVFVAALLDNLTHHFDWRWLGSQINGLFRPRRSNRAGLIAVLALILIGIILLLNSLNSIGLYRLSTSDALAQLVEFINTKTAPDARVETYDSEVLFLLNRPYHYPPDQIQVELNRRTVLGENTVIDYDPLVAANPDYVIVGPFARMWHLYDTVLKATAFRLVQTIGSYDVYERVRLD